MKELIVGLCIGMVILSLGYSLGKHAGYDRAIQDVVAATPVAKTTDQQCVAWLFDTNLKEVKKRICK